MQFTTVCVYPSASTRLAVLFLLAYPVGALFLSRYRASRAGPLSTSVVPLTLTPLFVGLAAAWLGVARIIESLSVAARGRAASAAGVAETFVFVAFASAIAAFVAGATLIREVIRGTRSEESGRASTLAKILAVALPLLVLAEIAVQVLLSHQLVTETATPSHALLRLALAVTAFSLFGGVTSLLWLVFARRNTTIQLSAARRMLALSSLAVASAICAGAWLLSRSYWSIAVSG